MKFLIPPDDGLIQVRQGELIVVFEIGEKKAKLDFLESLEPANQADQDKIKDLFDEIAITDYPQRYVN